MADNKTKTSTSDDNGAAAPKDDAGQAELQKAADEAAEKGYIGTVPDGPPNEAWSLESGPDSPSAAELRNRGK